LSCKSTLLGTWPEKCSLWELANVIHGEADGEEKPIWVNEVYKKGCQEKRSPSTGGREDFVSRSSPLHCKSASRFAREVLLLSCFPFLSRSSSGDDHCQSSLEKWQATRILTW